MNAVQEYYQPNTHTCLFARLMIKEIDAVYEETDATDSTDCEEPVQTVKSTDEIDEERIRRAREVRMSHVPSDWKMARDELLDDESEKVDKKPRYIIGEKEELDKDLALEQSHDNERENDGSILNTTVDEGTHIFFYSVKGKNGYMSNFSKTNFTWKGKQFTSSEQAFQYAKSMVFGCNKSADLILAASTPKSAKELGQGVEGFHEGEWEKHKFDAMKSVLLAKFQQNVDLRQRLLETGHRPIVEASSRDKVWGIGFSVSQAIKQHQGQWGRNLLGKALVEVRELLRDE